MAPPPSEDTATLAAESWFATEWTVKKRLAASLTWLRENLFYSWPSTAITLALCYVVARIGLALVDWAFANAVWLVPSGAGGADTSACRAPEAGACWAIVAEKYRFILFGTYPYEQHWRPALCILIFAALYAATTWRRMWGRTLALTWVVGAIAIGLLMWGGIGGLPLIPTERWGGLAITLILATFGLVSAFPLAILVALGRRSRLPAIRVLCVVYVEFIRGVPLISLLFMASVVLPLFLPDGMTLDKLLRAQIAITLFAAAYLAEVVRGGLQAIPKGQYEAADALGLSYWQKMGLIILPQALRIVIAPLVNTFIAIVKDTSLVLVIGLFDLLGAGKMSAMEPAWQGFAIEAFLFCGLIYFVICFTMSRFSQRLEVDLRASGNR